MLQPAELTVCGNTFYHTGCILLLQTGVLPVMTGDISLETVCNWYSTVAIPVTMTNLNQIVPESTDFQLSFQKSADWHARELTETSMFNPSQ